MLQPMPVPDFRFVPTAPPPPDPAELDEDDCQTEEEPEEEPEEEVEEEPEPSVSLNELHEELSASTSEARRGNRRTLEVLKNFGAVLDALSATVNDTHKAVRALPTTSRAAAGDDLSRDWALALVEMADRLGRVADGFARPPAVTTSWWPPARKAAAAWSEAWAMQSDALSILRGHLESLLKRAGLVRLQVLERPFDPATMTAVESVVAADSPDHTVLAELLPGWRHATTEQLIRPAQVRVSRRPTK